MDAKPRGKTGMKSRPSSPLGFSCVQDALEAHSVLPLPSCFWTSEVERWAKRCLLLRMQMAQKTESATTQLCKKPTFCSYTMVLVPWSRHSGQYQPNQPPLTLLQCRSGGAKEWPPSLSPQPKNTTTKEKESKERGRKGGGRKNFPTPFSKLPHECVGGRAAKKEENFLRPLGLFLSLFQPANPSFSSFLTMYLTGKGGEREGKKRGGGLEARDQGGGGGFASGAAMAGKGSPLDADSPINSHKNKKRIAD